MSPSKKKMAKPKEVSLEATPQAVIPKVELPNNENKLFGEDDDQATSSMADLSIEIKEIKEPSLIGVWDHAIDTFFKLSAFYPDGKSLHQWVHYQTMDTMEQFYQWDERQLSLGKFSSSYLENPRDNDRIPSTTPGAEPPRDAKDSGSARPHSTHLETSSTNRS